MQLQGPLVPGRETEVLPDSILEALLDWKNGGFLPGLGAATGQQGIFFELIRDRAEDFYTHTARDYFDYLAAYAKAQAEWPMPGGAMSWRTIYCLTVDEQNRARAGNPRAFALDSAENSGDECSRFRVSAVAL